MRFFFFFAITFATQIIHADPPTLESNCRSHLAALDPNLRSFMIHHDIDLSYIHRGLNDFSAAISALEQSGTEVDALHAATKLKREITDQLESAKQGIVDGGRFAETTSPLPVQFNAPNSSLKIEATDPLVRWAKTIEFHQIENFIYYETKRLHLVATIKELERQGRKIPDFLTQLKTSPRETWWKSYLDNAILESFLLFPNVQTLRENTSSFSSDNVAKGFRPQELRSAIFEGVLAAPLALAFHSFICDNRIVHKLQPTRETYGETARERANAFVEEVLNRMDELFGKE